MRVWHNVGCRRSWDHHWVEGPVDVLIAHHHGSHGIGTTGRKSRRIDRIRRSCRHTDIHGHLLGQPLTEDETVHLHQVCLPLQIPLEGVHEEIVMGDAVPVKDLLLLLRPDASVAVEKLEKGAPRLLEDGVGAGFEIA